MIISFEKQMHIGLSKDDAAKYCILPGDPGRCEAIAARLDNSRFLNSNREFTSYKGFIDGVPVLVCSTGIGGPSTAIAVDELAAIGVETLIRVGTCGGIDTSVKGGDIVIASAAVRQEGTTLHYAPIEYPAAADYSIVFALQQAAQDLGLTHHVGIVQSKDSFYGQHDPSSMPVGEELLDKWKAWKKLGVLASEMEASTVFTVGSVRRLHTGAVLQVLWNQERRAEGLPDVTCLDTDNAVRVAVLALKIIIGSAR